MELPTLERRAMEAYLRFSYPLGSAPFPGQRAARYAEIRFSSAPERAKEDYLRELSRILRDLLETERRISDAAFLSSGVDSSLIAFGIGAKKTFSVAYEEEEFDESELAMQAARRLGSEHHVVKIGPADYFGALDEAMACRGSPVGDASYVALFIAARAASLHTDLIVKLKGETDKKYGRILTRFPCAYTHPCRNRETDLGDLLAEGMREQLGADLALICSGSIRGESLGPIVTLQDFLEAYPYPTSMVGIHLTGAQLRRMVSYLMRDEAIAEDGDAACFQFSKGFFCEYDLASHGIQQLTMNGREVRDDDMFLAALEEYHYNLMETNLGIPPEELEQNGQPVQMATKASNVLIEYLSNHESIKLDGQPRLVIHDS